MLYSTMLRNKNLIIGIVLFVSIVFIYIYYANKKFTVFDQMTSTLQSSKFEGDDKDHHSSDNNKLIMDPSELLPNKNDDDKWTALNPINNKSMMVPDVLQSDFFIGINTVGSSKKNPNLQGREDPFIEKIDTSGKWNINSNDPR